MPLHEACEAASLGALPGLYSYVFASTLSYRVVAVCLLSVPVTHAVGAHVFGARHTGNNRSLLLAALSWLLWSFAGLIFLPVGLDMLPLASYSLTRAFPQIPHTHVDVVSGAAAAVSFIAWLLMIKAMLVLEDGSDSSSTADTGRVGKRRPVLASAVVVVLGLLLSVTAFLLLLALEHMPDLPSRVLYCCLSLSCLLIASSTTYGLGGHLRYSKHADDAPGVDKWQFFQPFCGGTAFVTTQAISWSIFAAALVSLVVLLQQVVAGVAHCFRYWALGAGTFMVMAQAMLGVSLLLWRTQGGPKSAASQLMRAASGVLLAPPPNNQSWLGANLPVLLMYMPAHTFFAMWVLSFVFLPRALAVSALVGFLLPYYALTHRGNPAHTGCREWPWLMDWFRCNIEGCLAHWFGSVLVVHDGDSASEAAAAAAGGLTAASHGAASNDKQQQQQQHNGGGKFPEKTMFGFAPHGLYPTGAGFLPWMPSFTKAFGGRSPITLTASVMFAAPFIKEIACWAGFRQVSRHTLLAALEERGAVLLIPGGQAEMVHAWRAFLPHPRRELVLHTRHKGFCRIAIEQQAALVPVLALGETLQLTNLYDMPALHAYTYKRLGFPVPFVLVGRWGVTPLPRKVGLVYVVGKPLRPPPHTPGQPVPAAAVDELHTRFYGSLFDLFQRHRHLHPEFAAARIVLTDD